MNANETYHARSERSSSQISCYLSDPIAWYHYWVAKDWERPGPTDQMQFGTNVHSMCELGGPQHLPIVGRPKGANFRQTVWKEWKKEQEANGKEVVNSIEAYESIWHHLRACDWTRQVLESSEKEVEHIWNDPILGPSRVKFDAVMDGLIVDWKTTNKTSERSFCYSILDMNYDVRLAMYLRGYRDRYGDDATVAIVAIQNKPGYGITIYKFSDEWMDDAEARLILAVEQMDSFDIDQHLNQKPITLQQPRFSQVDFGDLDND